MMKNKKISYFTLTLFALLILIYSVLFTQNTKTNRPNHFSTSSLIINEIMFKPSTTAGNKEWIEIFNRSENPISLINFQICDANYNWKNIVSDKVIAPEEYIVLARTTDTLAIQNYYETQIEFAGTDGWNSLNNDGDIVLLADNNNVILDSMRYSASGSYPNDISLERENPFDDEEIVWDACIDSSGATPGTTNSISPFEYDIQAYEIIIEEQDESSLSITGYCENVGFNDLSNCHYTFFIDCNRNNQIDTDEEISTGEFSIAEGMTETFSVQYNISQKDYYSFGFILVNTSDMDNMNNHVFTTYNSPFNYPIAINEIMHSPENGPEWLEFYNNFDYEINLNSWQIADPSQSVEITADILLSSEEFLILTSDTTGFIEQYPDVDCEIVNYLPSLNNSDDEITLYDNYHTAIDSLHYYSDWGEISGNSLERINPNINSNNPDNWESSINSLGATPGRENSLYIEMIKPQIELSIRPNPVSLKLKKSVFIYYNLPGVLSKINIRIFDMKGRMVRWLSDQQWIASQGEPIIWDCKDDNGRVVPIGIYIVHLEATGKQSGKIFQKTKTMVIGEK